MAAGKSLRAKDSTCMRSWGMPLCRALLKTESAESRVASTNRAWGSRLRNSRKKSSISFSMYQVPSEPTYSIKGAVSGRFRACRQPVRVFSGRALGSNKSKSAQQGMTVQGFKLRPWEGSMACIMLRPFSVRLMMWSARDKKASSCRLK